MKLKMKLFCVFLCFLVISTTINDSTDIHSKALVIANGDRLNEPIKNINPNQAMVALTFDDGPTRLYTTMILDCLKENNAYATFFVLGSRVDKAPDLLKRMILEGSEIGNHTYSHKQLTTLSDENISAEINQTNETIFKITHNNPTILRPPYGSYNESVINHLGEMKIVNWTVDSLDWKSKNVEMIVDKVMSEVKDKDIILLHDLFLSSAQAACILIPRLLEEGYQLVSVSDIFNS